MLPRIRKDFKAIVKETEKAILFRDYDNKEYWIPKSLCTLIKKKKGKVIATLAVVKFEEITNVDVEPLESTFASLGGDVLSSHKAPECEVLQSEVAPLKAKQLELVNRHINSRFTAWLCEAGTGKTICTTTIAYSRWKKGLIAHTYVLVPASLQKQWKEMVKNYYPDFNAITIRSIHATSMEDSLYRLSEEFKDIKGDVQLIIDESHLMRNQSARRSRNIEKTFRAKYVQIATAFPIERNAGDLYYQFGVMDRSIIGEENYGAFQSKFLLLGGNDGEQVVAYQNTAELNKRIAPYIARMSLKDVHGSLPDIIYKNIYFSLNTEQKQAYTALENLMAKLQDKNSWIPANKRYMINTFCLKISSGYTPSKEEIESVFGNLGKLGKDADNIRKIGGIAYNPNNNRIITLKKLLTQIGDEQSIIWCSYVDEITAIANNISSCDIIYGNTSMEERNNILDRFKRGKFKRLVISIAINEGFNLQNCHNAILYSDGYSRTKRENALKRIHRIGQEKQCYVYRLMADRSLDAHILKVGQRKDKVCKIFEK